MENDAGREMITGVTVYIDQDLEELIPDYIENRYKDIRSITGLLKDRHFHEIAMIGHSMKGSGEGYGFAKVTEIGASIEEAAKQGNAEVIEGQIELLAQYFKKVEIVYE